MENETNKEESTPEKKFLLAKHWDDLLMDEFQKETDRAAVILTASLFDNSLNDLLNNFLISNSSTNDELFDGPNAPLSTFSAKINVAYRVGLISNKFAHDLNLIRKIRNEFAHNIQGCSFENGKVRSRVLELLKNTNGHFKDKYRNHFPEGVRGDFLFASSWLLWSLNMQVEMCERIELARTFEFGYDDHKDIDLSDD
ncbi:hypothetical protein EHQ05_19220 [Leptospira yasudae]|uniref:hypothetical protein n=1 Tax=Leptospira yasudae TaxID=2202201 RepID=UPI001082E20E|nr:hypothetical protein [Leptospira yasudae]TGK23323.1 hypothetical protein EHQ05_19220 [Leptospira yasudae]TGM09800.1 hypothetical protein EHQ86_00040 [Leptospira yasudae]